MCSKTVEILYHNIVFKGPMYVTQFFICQLRGCVNFEYILGHCTKVVASFTKAEQRIEGNFVTENNTYVGFI